MSTFIFAVRNIWFAYLRIRRILSGLNFQTSRGYVNCTDQLNPYKDQRTLQQAHWQWPSTAHFEEWAPMSKHPPPEVGAFKTVNRSKRCFQKIIWPPIGGRPWFKFHQSVTACDFVAYLVLSLRSTIQTRQQFLSKIAASNIIASSPNMRQFHKNQQSE